MQIDLEKDASVSESFDEIIKLSEKHLDDGSINDLRHYFDSLLAVEIDEDDDTEETIKLIDMLNHLILTIPKRIDRLLELKAPQVIIDGERLALETIEKIMYENQRK